VLEERKRTPKQNILKKQKKKKKKKKKNKKKTSIKKKKKKKKEKTRKTMDSLSTHSSPHRMSLALNIPARSWKHTWPKSYLRGQDPQAALVESSTAVPRKRSLEGKGR